MKRKIDLSVLIVFILLISPYLIITGAFVRIKRFYRFTVDTTEKRTPKRYYW